MVNPHAVNPTVVLAFSGGLDTSFCVPWLREQDYDVITVTVDTGGFSPNDLEQVSICSRELGAIAHYTVDGRQALWDLVVGYIIKGNVLRGRIYPLCAGPERMVQAMHVVEVARLHGATAIAHGSTGAGNDQVRFDHVIRVLMPHADIFTPVRDLGAQRAMEVEEEAAAFCELYGLQSIMAYAHRPSQPGSDWIAQGYAVPEVVGISHTIA